MATGVQIGLQASLVGLVSSFETHLQSFWLAAHALTLLLVLMEASVSYLEQSRSLQPSIVLQLVFLLSSCVDVILLRSIWPYRSNTLQHAYWSVHVAVLVLKVLALLLETFVKGALDPACRRQRSPEDFSGLFGLATFAWLNPLLFTGYKKCLVASDLYPLPSPLTADRLLPRNSAASQKWSTTIMASSLPAQAIVTMIPRALVSAFSFAQVFLLQAVLRHLQHMDEQTSSSVSHLLVLATFLVYAGMALSSAWYWRANEKMLLMGRSLLMGILYSQTMMGSVANTTDTEVVTLVGTELERIRQGFERLHDLWCCPIEVTVAVWLLFRQLGPSAVAPIAAVVFVALCTAAIGKAIPKSQRAWLTARQERVSFTAEAVKSLEALQIANLPRAVQTLLRNMRNRDISMGQRFRLQQLSIIILAYVPTHVSPVLAFAFTTATIDVTTLFSSIALIMLLSKPLETLIQTFPPFLTSLACFGRIRKYLSKGRRENTRPMQVAARDHSRAGIAIEMNGCSFGWSPERPVLRDVNALIPIHSFTVVSGPTGSGKSTLCKALIGEVPIASGYLQLLGTTSDPVGFCDQQPFLLNTTIQRNITGLLPFDRQTYQKVLEVVMLVDDLQQMECGDHTEVGSHGSNLSGGQKQRIALARALYARPSLYVLDDVFIGLDATMAQRIFDNALGPMGWIKSHGGTVIFASNDLNIESADYNMILDCNGGCRIEEHCRFDYETTPTKGGPVESISVATARATALLANAEDHSTCSNTESFTEASHEGDIEKASPTVFANADGALDETTVQFESNSRHYKYYLKASGGMAFLLFACLASFYAFFFNMSTVWISFWTSDRFHQPRSVYLGAYGLLQALTLIFQYASMSILFLFNIRTSGRIIHSDALEALAKAPLRLRASMDHGKMTALFSQDINLIDGELPAGVLNTVISSCIAVGLLAVLALSSPYILVTVPFLIVVLLIIQRLYLRTARRLRILELETKEPIYAHFLEALRGCVYVRAFCWEQHLVRTNNILIDTSARAAYLLQMVRHWLEFVLDMMITALATLLVALAFHLHSNAAVSGASLISVLGMAQVLNTVILLDSAWPARASIVIEGINASYPGRETNSATAPPALRNFSLNVDPACKVAIVGRSGSGKSSIMRLLLRILDQESGSIHIGDVPLNEIDPELLRERIIALPQETVLLPGASIKLNMDPYNESAHEECLEVLRLVGLSRLVPEDGTDLDAILSSESLSQGEFQLFSLARCVLRRRQRRRHTAAAPSSAVPETMAEQGEAAEKGQEGGILLLDELCSAVDQKTYQDMWKIVWDEFHNYTVLAIVHRLEETDLERFDRVLFMNHGVVERFGRPQSMVGSELW
ncbi:P-loop containing nucleoside triphosphate hydrolase protein [Periconia macrospinosa]|uniref:P-loop containing nucleoside triphosphate hydrolase protein n=1 Tax=Periconia macrospinosa TaxID=97972 RepID=A0A2V1D9Y1_9PLEO|nr:P-loop containing nucleoside triphosphate hydrolase protein [Periconia macrospinosa]